MRVTLIVNPRSAGGGTASRLDVLERAAREVFGDSVILAPTERPGHASDLAAAADTDLLVSVGGDGTANEVVNGLARLERDARPVLGVLAAGTGCDLVKTLGMPRDVRAALELMATAEPIQADWVRVGLAGGIVRRSINVAGLGLSGAVVDAVNRGSKALGGKVSFALATARATMAWRAPVVRVAWEGPEGRGSWEGPIATVFVANGRYCGGGMLVGPGGRIDDGIVEMTIVPQMPQLRFLRNARRLYDGTIAEVPGVVHTRVRAVRAEVPDGSRVLVDVDGEQPGDLPAELEVEPSAVRIVSRTQG
ncbi:MAG: diacylglycerol kinase family lipid kinase [Alphaproteobacteria bacterium]|nr:diacylglycerol kinase family lipid kinase [Alphaproteobacteria bacterium]